MPKDARDEALQADRAARLSARLDAVPVTARLWRMVITLSLGAFCEIFNLGLSPALAPGLVASGILKSQGAGLFSVASPATFVASTFAGLWVGALAFSGASDRWGRLPVLRYSLVCYTVTTLGMALQSRAIGIDVMRFLTGMGMSVQAIAIDCFIAEVVPRAVRGRAFAISTAIQFCAVPVVGIAGLILIPRHPFGFDGWRYLSVLTLVLAAFVLFVQRGLFESPRWLAQKGRLAEAEDIVARIEARAGEGRRSIAANVSLVDDALHHEQEMSPRAYRRRLTILAAVNFMQAIGYYGFMNWVPSLLQAKGADLSHSLGYSAAIALSFPLAPLLFVVFADRLERKHQLIIGSIGAAACGLLFAHQTTPTTWIVFGVLVTVTSNLMAFAIHAYQSEIFTTAARSRAVGFVYSFTRLSTIFSGYLVAYLLRQLGIGSVFLVLDGVLLCSAATVALFGPRTRGLALEQIAR